eukprot:916647-Rhodomonas_salina.5
MYRGQTSSKNDSNPSRWFCNPNPQILNPADRKATNLAVSNVREDGRDENEAPAVAIEREKEQQDQEVWVLDPTMLSQWSGEESQMPQRLLSP